MHPGQAQRSTDQREQGRQGRQAALKPSGLPLFSSQVEKPRHRDGQPYDQGHIAVKALKWDEETQSH